MLRAGDFAGPEDPWHETMPMLALRDETTPGLLLGHLPRSPIDYVQILKPPNGERRFPSIWETTEKLRDELRALIEEREAKR